jgi:hypothetical protein
LQQHQKSEKKCRGEYFNTLDQIGRETIQFAILYDKERKDIDEEKSKTGKDLDE